MTQAITGKLTDMINIAGGKGFTGIQNDLTSAYSTILRKALDQATDGYYVNNRVINTDNTEYVYVDALNVCYPASLTIQELDWQDLVNTGRHYTFVGKQ